MMGWWMVNRRGYMLVEIILATAIAFGIAYFMLNMTIKLKNKNDDLLVETLTATDQGIITNNIMRSLKGASCSTINSANGIQIQTKNVMINNELVMVVNKYVNKVGPVDCTLTNYNDVPVVHLHIPMSVKQLPNRNFDIELDWILSE